MTLITDSKRSQFAGWAREFEADYLLAPAGQRHLASYAAERDHVTRSWSEAKSAKNSGKDITDLVLYKLLPDSNTRHNREQGYRISVTPAITKDIKRWFENAGWQKAENWIWYKPVPPFFLFEVEDGGTMREALHRLYNSMAFDARFVLVCPAHNREKFDKWVTTAPFKEFAKRYEFRTYQELFAFYRATLEYTAIRSRFLRM